MITREEILQSGITAELIEEFKHFYTERTFPNCEWKEFVETKLNEGKFKTEDGVMVGDKTVMYGVYHHNFNVAPNLTPSQIDKANTPCKWFSTPDARQNWIEDNKPCLSKKEVVSIIDKYTFGNNCIYEINNLVKSKQ